MNSFNSYIIGIYKDLNEYIIEYLVNSNDIDEQQQQLLEQQDVVKTLTVNDFIEIGTDLIKKSNDKSIEIDIANQYLEFVMCMCFFTGNEKVWRPLITSNSQLFANKVISKNFIEGIPFCFAIPFGCTSLLDLLLQYGMDVTLKIDNSYLMTSVLYGNIDAYDFFIAHNAPTNHANSNGDTALLFAAMNGDDILIEKLARAGEDLKAINLHGFNVFICAAFHNRASTIAILAKLIERTHGKKRLQAMLDLKDKDGETPLHIASRLGFAKSVKVLLECGSEINIANKNKQTPYDLSKKGLQLSKKSSNSSSNNSSNNIIFNNSLNTLNNNSNNNSDIGKSSIKEDIESLVYVNQLLPINFKEKLIIKSNNSNQVKKTTKSYIKTVKIFDDFIKLKEQEISKNLESLIAIENQLNQNQQSKKSKSSKNKQQSKIATPNKDNNNKSQQQQPQQSQQSKSSNNNSNGKITTTINKKNNKQTLEEQTKSENQQISVQKDLDKIKTKDNNDLKEQDEELNLIKSNNNVNSSNNNINSNNNHLNISKENQIQINNEYEKQENQTNNDDEHEHEQEQEQLNQQENVVQYNQLNQHQNQQQDEIDYREKYKQLAVLYLEQANRLKETINQLTEIEDHFIQFKEQLYERNQKAEALGLGISEILGIGIEFLSTEQLNVLSSIHIEFIKNIENQKIKLKQYNSVNDPPPDYN